MKDNMNKFVKAIKRHNMISDGDVVAVGLSGGKDSLLLLKYLVNYQKFSEQKFEIIAITIDMGFKGSNFSKLQEYTKELGVKYEIVKSDIAQVLFEIRKEKNPCSLCAKLRRGILCSTAKEMGATKLALGHHSDDLIETFFLSMIFEGRLSTFQPVSLMERAEITVIRPIIYFDEDDVKKESASLPVFKNPCPADKYTKREEIKTKIKELQSLCPKSKNNIYRAIVNPDRYNLWRNDK